MKLFRSLLVALGLSVAATAAYALRARAASTTSSCVSSDYCFCMDIDCYMGSQLCATGPGFECYQPG
jgi:hypothetical protein